MRRLSKCACPTAATMSASGASSRPSFLPASVYRVRPASGVPASGAAAETNSWRSAAAPAVSSARHVMPMSRRPCAQPSPSHQCSV